MLLLKKKYYLFIENTRDFNLDLIKNKNKFCLIYRNQFTNDKVDELLKFRRACKKNRVEFYVANNTVLLTKLNADGLYISAYNKNLLLNVFRKNRFKVIGSAHNQKEIDIKIKQGCETIIFSRLFKTLYPEKKGHLGIHKFNILSLRSRIKLVPLGGINEKNLNKLNMVKSNSFACLSMIKKKPAKIVNRLF